MKIITLLSIVLFLLLLANCSNKNEEELESRIDIIQNDAEEKIDVNVNGKLFTSFLYTDDLSMLKKPVLYPLVSANGVTVTRGYPLNPRPNERTDHPHHIGAWLNYGDVNGLDFWNNSDAIAPEKAAEMGTIRVKSIDQIKSGQNVGELDVTSEWLNFEDEVILEESTKFIFKAGKGKRIIDRITTLKALNNPVFFNDNKEGMLGIRMARQLEHPSDKPVTLSDAHGQKTDVPVLDNTGVTGQYLSSEGATGVDVWGKRANWVALSGTIDGKDVTVVIMDKPGNIGYPTYWHARGYGLFAANPLGQKVFSEGKEELNFALKAEESVTFTYRILLLDGNAQKNRLDNEYSKFIGDK